MPRLQGSRFRPGDSVYLKNPSSPHSGPFKVALANPAAGKYILSHENGRPAMGGATGNEEDLTPAS